jgi:sugar (pentulose or hexulose) kinase
MSKLPVIAIFDIGKTNKKLFLFDEQYKIVLEQGVNFPEIEDEDGDPCEDLEKLSSWIFLSLNEVLENKKFEIRAINFSAYGASFVYVDEEGKPLTPLYNYLKKYPQKLSSELYEKYGGEITFSNQTASPVLGSLNSGLQLYRLKKEKPEVFNKIRYALHLPQYLSYLVTGRACNDITSIGCHTALWDFTEKQYHQWVKEEGLTDKFPSICPAEKTGALQANPELPVGVGLHDSSAALIPYLVNFHEPFVLISTGTWCISLNPFNHTPLTTTDLENDCLCYLSYRGMPVKASRLFAGHEHEQQVKRISEHFKTYPGVYKTISYDARIIGRLEKNGIERGTLLSWDNYDLKESGFSKRDLSQFSSDIEAYHQLMLDIAKQQYISTLYVLKGAEVKRIFVDGGFSKNSIFMNLLASFFPEMEIFAASMAQATAIGTALSIHNSWNRNPVPSDLIELKYYSVGKNAVM